MRNIYRVSTGEAITLFLDLPGESFLSAFWAHLFWIITDHYHADSIRKCRFTQFLIRSTVREITIPEEEMNT